MNPSAADILEAIDAVPTEDVLVLPEQLERRSHRRAGGGAERQERAGRSPRRSVQAGLAAMARFVSSAPPDENERAMLEGLADAATGEITVASRDAVLDGIEIREGAFLGLVEGVAVASDTDLDTVVAGGDRARSRRREGGSHDPDAARIRRRSTASSRALEQRHPDVEVDVHEGGQPHYPLLFVAE